MSSQSRTLQQIWNLIWNHATRISLLVGPSQTFSCSLRQGHSRKLHFLASLQASLSLWVANDYGKILTRINEIYGDHVHLNLSSSFFSGVTNKQVLGSELKSPHGGPVRPVGPVCQHGRRPTAAARPCVFFWGEALSASSAVASSSDCASSLSVGQPARLPASPWKRKGKKLEPTTTTTTTEKLNSRFLLLSSQNSNFLLMLYGLCSTMCQTNWRLVWPKWKFARALHVVDTKWTLAV